MKTKIYISVALVAIAISSFTAHEFFKKNKSLNLEVNKPALVLNTVNEDIVVKGDLLGKAELSFAGGTEERNKNIQIGVEKINGKVIESGEEFSFAKALGPVTEEEGFSEAKVFLNGEVTKGLGGGLCQVSTTLFQSLLHAGLPITERHNHTYTVSYYDVGLDATYSDPGPDLKFINDTDGPIIIKGKTEDKKVIFEIYGKNDGRIASTTEAIVYNVVDFPETKYVATTTRGRSEPDCINSPQIGYTTKVIYNIFYPNGETKSQDFTSKYRPLQRICYVRATSTTAMSGSQKNGI